MTDMMNDALQRLKVMKELEAKTVKVDMKKVFNTLPTPELAALVELHKKDKKKFAEAICKLEESSPEFVYLVKERLAQSKAATVFYMKNEKGQMIKVNKRGQPL